MRHDIGTRGWFEGEGLHSKGGVVDAVLDLLLADEISQDKARELIQYATCPHTRSQEPLPAAPWDALADIQGRRAWKEALPARAVRPLDSSVPSTHQRKQGPKGKKAI